MIKNTLKVIFLTFISVFFVVLSVSAKPATTSDATTTLFEAEATAVIVSSDVFYYYIDLPVEYNTTSLVEDSSIYPDIFFGSILIFCSSFFLVLKI